MPQPQAQVGRTLTEKLLLAGAFIVLALAIVKMSIIGYYPSELPLLLIALVVAMGLGYASEKLRKDRIRQLDREHGVG